MASIRRQMLFETWCELKRRITELEIETHSYPTNQNSFVISGLREMQGTLIQIVQRIESQNGAYEERPM